MGIKINRTFLEEAYILMGSESQTHKSNTLCEKALSAMKRTIKWLRSLRVIWGLGIREGLFNKGTNEKIPPGSEGVTSRDVWTWKNKSKGSELRGYSEGKRRRTGELCCGREMETATRGSQGSGRIQIVQSFWPWGSFEFVYIF